MMDNDFEGAFGEYLDSAEYDAIANELFAATRNAFLAGWIAAGGSVSAGGHLFEVFAGKESRERGSGEEKAEPSAAGGGCSEAERPQRSKKSSRRAAR